MKRCPTTGKVKFRDKLEAEIALSRMQSKGRDEIRAYQCPQCDRWHVTRMPLATTRGSDAA